MDTNPNIDHGFVPGARIKREPSDEDWVMGGTTLAQAGLSMTQASKMMRRATDSEGRPFNTQCFEYPYINRPQFHRLKCGHDVATHDVDICGANCQPASRFTGSDLKAVFKPFECPHPDCQAQAQVAPRKHPKTGRRILGRPCQLGHVRGRDDTADREWDVQKLDLLRMQSESRRVIPRYKELLRKTSRSPPSKQKTEQPKEARARRPTLVTAADINASLDNATRALLVAQRGKHTRRIRGNRLETMTDTALDNAERDLDIFGLDGGEAAKRRARAAADANSSRPDLVIYEDTTRLHDSCDACGLELTEIHHRCKQCSDDGDTRYALCSTCYAGSYDQHLREHPTHQLVLEDFHTLAEESQFHDSDNELAERSEVSCTCKSTDLQYMIQCQGCKKPFHPGCVGKGLHAESQYELPNRDEFFKADFENLQALDADDFLCRACEALMHFQSGISQQRRAAKRHEDFLLQYKPKLMSQKYLAMNRAETDEQRSSVDEHFAAIEEEMDAGTVLTESHWKALLAKSLRVPLPPPKPQKRTARDVEIDEQQQDAVPGADRSASTPDRPASMPEATKRMRADDGRGQAYKLGGQMTLPVGGTRRRH